MNGKTKFLVPEEMSVAGETPTDRLDLLVSLPLGGLASSNVGCGLLCLFSQPAGTVWVLFADGLAIGKVLCAVDNDDEGSNDRPVEAHVGEDAGGVRAGDGV